MKNSVDKDLMIMQIQQIIWKKLFCRKILKDINVFGISWISPLQALASTPLEPHTANPVMFQNEPMIEYDRNFNPLRDELLIHNIGIENGKVKVPDGPGLGVDVDMDVLRKFV
ncbi:MAG: enolase C-terminal domain-like protein [Eubacteriales bacterium]|nr:enolase C-terminal domain-like protein [Eubacteriales bacterium]